MYEERGKTLPDGRIEVIVSDPSTGQEVVRYYSPGAEPKVSLGDLVLKGGFLRDELIPPSVAKKGDLTPLATKEELRTATSDVVIAEDIEDVVRKSTLFDTEHNMILPELIPEAEVAVKWIKGVGRPDKPETTRDAIIGDEEDCTRYLSTDGAGTGAWEWEKRGGVWHVVRGDTGWRAIKFPKDSAVTNKESFFLLRRVGDTVFAAVGGDTDKGWSVPTIMIDKEIRSLIWLPRGFIACNQIFTPFTADVKGVAKGLVDTIGVIINVYPDSQAIHNHSYECLLQVRLHTQVWNSGVTSCRGFIPEFNYSTVEPWPDTLPGDSFGICYV